MSNVLGIIAEYNPFHNGHLYHLENSKKQTGCDYSVAIISGNFTERGSTSIIDKWEKTQMAIDSGVDLVIELPVLYSISSSENFAEGSIKILNSLGIIDYLSFGSEDQDIKLLDDIATILANEPEAYKSLLTTELNKGLSFPASRQNALLTYLDNSAKYSDILSCPNNILGIEYLKALKKYNSNIIPHCIKRFESEYNSDKISNNIASSTAIRTLIKNNNIKTIKNIVPASSYSILIDSIKNGHTVIDLSVFEKEIIYILRKMTIEEIKKLPDVSEGLEFLIKKAVNSCNKLSELINIVKSKRYTQTRIQRILLYTLLGITKEDMNISKKTSPYIRILGFNRNGKKLISTICKNNPNLPVITSVKSFIDSNSDSNLQRLLDIDILATNIYTLGFKNDSFSNLDFKNKIIKKGI